MPRAINELEKIEENYIKWLLKHNEELAKKKMTKSEQKLFTCYHCVPEIIEVKPMFDLGEPISVEK